MRWKFVKRGGILVKNAVKGGLFLGKYDIYSET